MKKWNMPLVEELNVQETAYSPEKGSTVDGGYLSNDGRYDIPTYGPSTGNAGTPDVDVY